MQYFIQCHEARDAEEDSVSFSKVAVRKRRERTEWKRRRTEGWRQTMQRVTKTECGPARIVDLWLNLPRSPALHPRVTHINIHGQPCRGVSVYYYRKSFLRVLGWVWSRGRAGIYRSSASLPERMSSPFLGATSSGRAKRARTSNFNSRTFPLAQSFILRRTSHTLVGGNNDLVESVFVKAG